MRHRGDTRSLAVLEPSRSAEPGTHATTIMGFDETGRPVVDVGGVPTAARATVSVSHEDVGREATVTFLDGDAARPVITGLFIEPKAPTRRRHVKLAAEELDLEAAAKITLTCGKASITLHRDGKIVVSGVDVLVRASGTNRIRGGTIALN